MVNDAGHALIAFVNITFGSEKVGAPEQGVPVEIPSQYKKISRPRRAINNTFMAQKVVFFGIFT